VVISLAVIVCNGQSNICSEMKKSHKTRIDFAFMHRIFGLFKSKYYLVVNQYQYRFTYTKKNGFNVQYNGVKNEMLSKQMQFTSDNRFAISFRRFYVRSSPQSYLCFFQVI
jgi:hypothetical protein